MKTIAIIQARMGSTRLPGKVLLPIGNTNAIQIIIDKCKVHSLINEVVIATTENEKDKEIQIYCIKNNIKFYVGSEKNVLKRVYKAAETYKADIIIDITADCPFIDLTDLHIYLDLINDDYDYVSNIIDRTFPDGLDLQVYTFKALERLIGFNWMRKPEYYQHAGWNFTLFTDMFNTLNIYAEEALNWPELRITLDTTQDYAVINLIWAWLGSNATPLKIVNFMKNNPNIMTINSDIKSKTSGKL